MGEYDTRIPTDIPFEEYSKLQLKQSIRKNWEVLAQTYTLVTDAKTTLGDLMERSRISRFPFLKIPSLVFSVLIYQTQRKWSDRYPRRIPKYKIWSCYFESPGTKPEQPDFKQQIQVNVNGQIGDKLTIAADWNTQRTFEYENQLHLKYTGYEDEVVQSVEAGNVSLPTNSSFISGGSALFGIMQNSIRSFTFNNCCNSEKGSDQRDIRTWWKHWRNIRDPCGWLFHESLFHRWIIYQ